MLNDKQKTQLEKLAVAASHLRSKRGTVEQEIARIAANVQKLILEGRNPGEEHKEKKNELARLDADIAKLQVEAQGIASAMVSQAHVQCAEFQNQVLASRRKVGEKLLEFVTAWIELGRMTAEFGDAKSRREFNAYLEGQAKGVGLLKIDRLDPNGAIPLQPSWSWNSIRAGNFDEALKQMVKELTGYPFQQ